MGLKINRGETPRGPMVADRRLCLTADRTEVVEAGDARSAFLFATPGMVISASDAERLSLQFVDGVIVLPGAVAAVEAAEDEESKVDEESEPRDDASEDDVEDDVPEWTLKTPPEEYLEKHPDGPNAEIARRVLAERGSDGEA